MYQAVQGPRPTLAPVPTRQAQGTAELPTRPPGSAEDGHCHRLDHPSPDSTRPCLAMKLSHHGAWRLSLVSPGPNILSWYIAEDSPSVILRSSLVSALLTPSGLPLHLLQHPTSRPSVRSSPSFFSTCLVLALCLTPTSQIGLHLSIPQHPLPPHHTLCASLPTPPSTCHRGTLFIISPRTPTYGHRLASFLCYQHSCSSYQ